MAASGKACGLEGPNVVMLAFNYEEESLLSALAAPTIPLGVS